MMNRFLFLILSALLLLTACKPGEEKKEMWAEDILGNPDYQAISFGGYRGETRDSVPSIIDLKEDLRILHAMGIRILRTYNTQQFGETPNLLEAIHQLKEENPDFEMYLMLGAWIDCKNAFSDLEPDHNQEDFENNKAEIDAAVNFAIQYPDIVKVIAVGNEAMVHWATSYFVQPDVILKWVDHLQELKALDSLDHRLWITSSDNFASWGGGDSTYHKEALNELIKRVDFISMHTYPFHDTHYNPDFWQDSTQNDLPDLEKSNAAMARAIAYSQSQYESVREYMLSLGVEKAIHIGETGWASRDHEKYGSNGSKAADEYKMALFHDAIRKWTDEKGMSCFYFEAFNEPWKDPYSVDGSENHFGLINLKGEAKRVLWDEVDQGVFEGLSRGGFPITKSYGGNLDSLMKDVFAPPVKTSMEKDNTAEN